MTWCKTCEWAEKSRFQKFTHSVSRAFLGPSSAEIINATFAVLPFIPSYDHHYRDYVASGDRIHLERALRHVT